MALEDILDDIENEQLRKNFEIEWKKKHQLAIKWNWNFTNFKRIFSQFLKRKYSEDQWVFDYEFYVDTLNPYRYEHPLEWAEFHYQEDWDIEKAKKFIDSLKQMENPIILNLPLKKKWFEMTKAGIKKEDYREINEYWIRRLTRCSTNLTDAKNELLKEGRYALDKYADLDDLPDYYRSKHFDFTRITSGYPSSNDYDRILFLKFDKIRIGYGQSDWGADPSKMYFIIMHELLTE